MGRSEDMYSLRQRVRLSPAGLLRAVALGTALAVLAPAPAVAQLQDNPVYLDDSLRAVETLRQIDDLLAVGSLGEAARAAQLMLDEEGDRLVASADDEALYLPVRQRVHEALLARPALLERYRVQHGPAAERLLAAGAHDEVARRYLLTTAGYEAALRVAQLAIEGARFFDAVRALEELAGHPDRAGVRAIDAGLLAADAASYLLALEPRTGEPAASAVQTAAMLGAPDETVRAADVPPIDGRAAASSMPLTGPVGIEPDLEGLVSRPLRSVPIGAAGEDALDQLPTVPLSPGSRGRPRAVPWTMPVVRGDRLYLADGSTLSAIDRFTLRAVWQTTTGSGETSELLTISERARVGRLLEDIGSVAVGDGIAVAAGGLARGGTRDGDSSLYGVETETGRILWRLDPGELEGLEDASVRGPAAIVDGVVAVTVRQSLRTRRLVLLTMLGIDAQTGEVLWRRPLGSAGSLPFQQYNRLAEAPAVAQGLVIRSDEIGVIAAIEASTGRPVWVRRARSVQATASREQVYTMPTPLVVGDRVVLLSPDRGDVLQLDAQTGAVLAMRSGGELGDPAYLVRAGDYLAAIGSRRTAFVPFDALATAGVQFTPRLDEPGPFARAVAAGGNVLMPVDGGVLVQDPENPTRPRRIELAHSGNVVALDGQLIAVDEARVHAFVRWEAAASLLRRRLEEDPRDPDPAVTLAELAYHAGRTSEIASAVDDALEALASAPASDTRDALGDRLFDALMAMLDPPPSLPDEAQRPTAQLPGGVRLALLDRVLELARTPDQRVSATLARGGVFAGTGDTAGAVEAYQSILTDRALAGALARASGLTTRADLIASRRLHEVLRTSGLSVYGPYERAAELEASTPGADPEAVARRYPFSAQAVAQLSRTGGEHLAQDRPDRAAAVLLRAFETAELRAAAGSADAGLTPEGLASLRARALVFAGRVDEAAAFVRDISPRMGEGFPGAELRATLDAGSGPLASAQIGTFQDELSAPVVLAGRPLEPLTGPDRHDLLLAFAPGTRELMLYRVEAGRLVEAWASPVQTDATRAPMLVSYTDAGATVFWLPEDDGAASAGGVFESLALADGSSQWTSASFPGIAAELPVYAGDPDRQMIVLEGRVRREQVMLAATGRTAVVLDRRGRAAGYDVLTGATLWTEQLGVGQVLDAVVSGGALVVAFDAYEPGADIRSAPEPVIASYEARTGAATHLVESIRGRPRWLRPAPRGGVVAGLESGVLRFDPGAGVVDWVNTDPALRATYEAWHLGAGNDRLYVLDNDRALWAVDAGTGTLVPKRLNLYGRIAGRGVLLAHELGERVAFVGSGGALLFDAESELIAADAGASDDAIVSAAGASEGLVMVSGRSERIRVDLLDGRGLRLADTLTVDTPADARFQSVSLRDGLVVLVFEGASIVLPAAGLPLEPNEQPAG